MAATGCAPGHNTPPPPSRSPHRRPLGDRGPLFVPTGSQTGDRGRGGRGVKSGPRSPWGRQRRLRGRQCAAGTGGPSPVLTNPGAESRLRRGALRQRSLRKPERAPTGRALRKDSEWWGDTEGGIQGGDECVWVGGYVIGFWGGNGLPSEWGPGGRGGGGGRKDGCGVSMGRGVWVDVRGVAALRSGGCWRRGAAVNDNAAVAVATAMMLRQSPVRSEGSGRNRGGGGYGGYGMRTTGERVPP